MHASKGIFRALLAVGLTLFVLTVGLFVLQEPGTRGYVVTILSLGTQLIIIAIGAAGLYFEWEPLSVLEE
ncbi:hypothetical protein [Halosimplex sp. J119]